MPVSHINISMLLLGKETSEMYPKNSLPSYLFLVGGCVLYGTVQSKKLPKT